ncbi:MAG: gas vesicle protein GvpD P-loop domain-containing protein [Candidatus Helarchaeota archaeon]
MGILKNSIPDEILKAFDQKYGFSLLIKGDAGTGKTTFALEILARKQNAFYISSRVTPMSLYNQFPWIRNIPKENIIDGTQIDLQYTGITKKEAILNAVRFRNIPDFIKLIYHKAEESKNGEKITIVVDSWDAILGAIVQEWEKKNLPGSNETILAELTRQLNINLILIVETNEKSFLDYIVDGIITMEKIEFNSRRMRILTIEKLRGITIKNFKYLFTLKDGRFHCFTPEYRIFKLIDKIKIQPKSLKDKLNTGIKDFDELIGGGFPLGSKNIFILGENIGKDYLILLNPLIINQIENYKPVIHIPSFEYNSSNINILTKITKNPKIFDYYKIFEKNSLDDQSPNEYKKQESDLISNVKQYFQLCKKDEKTPILFIYSIDILETIYGHDLLYKNLVNLWNDIKDIPHVEIIIIKCYQKSSIELTYLAEYLFNILKFQDNLVLYGNIPNTGLFCVELEDLEKTKTKKLKLTPIL